MTTARIAPKPAWGEQLFRDVLLLGMALVVFVILTLTGADWGVPSEARVQLEPPPEQLHALPREMIDRSWDYWSSRGRDPERHAGYTRDLFNAIRSYHPDEYVILKSLSNMNPGRLDFDPRLYLYPALHFYCVGAALKLASLAGYVHLVKDMSYYVDHPEQMARMYIVGRWLSIVLGAGAIVVLFVAARRWRRHAGLVVLALAVSPVFVVHSHYMTRDVPGAFLATVLFLSSICLAQTGRKKWYVLAAVAVGLCAGTNYMWLVLWVVIPTAHVLAVRRGLRRALDGWVALTVLIVGATFLLSAFYALVHPREMGADFYSEVCHWTGAGAWRRLAMLAWVPHLLQLLPAMFGYPMAVLIVGGVVAAAYEAVRKPDHLDALLFAWLLPPWLIVGIDGRDYSRYYVIIAPLLALFAVRALLFAWERSRRSEALRHWARPTTLVLAAFSLAYALFLSVGWSNLFATKNVRLQAGEWIAEHIKPGATIAMTKDPWQYEMPPIDSTTYRILITGEDIQSFTAARAEYFIASSAQYGPALRDRQGPAYAFWSYALEFGPPYEVFQRSPSLSGLLLPPTRVPEDMTYVNPKIVLYKRAVDASE